MIAGVVGAVCGLVVFGAFADIGDRFALAADVPFLPMVAVAALVWLLPETKGGNRSPVAGRRLSPRTAESGCTP